MTKRRDFLKLALASYPVLAGSKLLTACSSSTGSDFENDEFPSSAYQQAGHLYNRYCEHFNIKL